MNLEILAGSASNRPLPRFRNRIPLIWTMGMGLWADFRFFDADTGFRMDPRTEL
jgi:hypothetical protein